MTPRRCASAVAQLISQLSKSAGKKLPEPWTPSDFISLINSYRSLVKVNRPDSSGKLSDADELMRQGQGYEAGPGMGG